MTFHPFTLHYHMNMDDAPEIVVVPQAEIAIVAVGDSLRIFATDAQLAELVQKVAVYFAEKKAASLEKCDLCGCLIDDYSRGQSTAETVLCLECVGKANRERQEDVAAAG